MPPSRHDASEPVPRHCSQEVPRDRIAGPRTDHRVDPATWTQCCLANPLPLVRPVLNLGRRVSSATVESPTDFAAKHFVAVTNRMVMRSDYVGGHHRIRFPSPNGGGFACFWVR